VVSFVRECIEMTMARECFGKRFPDALFIRNGSRGFGFVLFLFMSHRRCPNIEKGRQNSICMRVCICGDIFETDDRINP